MPDSGQTFLGRQDWGLGRQSKSFFLGSNQSQTNQVPEWKESKPRAAKRCLIVSYKGVLTTMISAMVKTQHRIQEEQFNHDISHGKDPTQDTGGAVQP